MVAQGKETCPGRGGASARGDQGHEPFDSLYLLHGLKAEGHLSGARRFEVIRAMNLLTVYICRTDYSLHGLSPVRGEEVGALR